MNDSKIESVVTEFLSTTFILSTLLCGKKFETA